MKKKDLKGILILIVFISCSSPDEQPDTGMQFHTRSAMQIPAFFVESTDVGNPEQTGSTRYNPAGQTYTLTGGGSNMWNDRDAFQFAWKKISGNFLIRAHAEFTGEGGDPHRKMGVIIRSGLETDAAYVDVAVHGDGLTAMQYRSEKGSMTAEVTSTVTSPDVIQLERKDGKFIMSAAVFGDAFSTEALDGIDLGDEVYVGLFMCSHNRDVTETAVFSNVRVVVPAPDTLVQYRDYIGSNLEIMDVATGEREILYQSDGSVQAPNWTPDGEALIYNQDGLLYRFDLKTGLPEVINTGFATRNNNDHVLSPEGNYIGISHHSADHGGQSIVYTVPVEGGTPRQVTDLGPSYLHGWSPDGKFLTYTGGRNGQYDIYVIPVEGGDEIRLTDFRTLDDGSEYSPDGTYIYFNSARSGSMEIWRMRPDGSDQEQLTDDTLNNWFPHISPDGQTMVFLSFPADVDPGDHPFYKHVTLRMMPADGGRPAIIAYLYGGQGTINVPSWSPDSKRIAFVSNTKFQDPVRD
jgi:TolB protein